MYIYSRKIKIELPMINVDRIIENYYTKGSDLYNTLVVHSQQVANRSVQIAESRNDLQLDIDFIFEAAMLHDIGIFKCYAPKIFCNGNHRYIEHGYLGAELLRNEGLERHALVCERHTGVGFSLEMIEKNQLPLPNRNMIPQTMEEQLICYADKFYSKSHLGETHSVDAIRKDLARFGEFQVMIFNKWHQFFDPTE